MARESIFAAAWRLNRVFPLLIVGLLLVDLAAFAWLAWGVSPQVEALERRYIERQAQARQTRQGAEAARSPQEVFRQGQADLQRFREAIPPQSEFTALVSELFALAEVSGLVIDRVSYKPEEEKPGLLRYGLQFSVAGTYGEVKRFIHALEQSERLIAIETLGLSGAGAVPGQVQLRLELSTLFRTDS